MTYSEEVRQRVIEYLKIKPINHGQLDIAQIYVPSEDAATLLPEYVQVIHQFKANLHPIIVRRTDQYGEDQEYELVYGGDWYQAAKAGGLTKIWVWVFDLTDEQVAQVQQLLGSLTHSSPKPLPGQEPPIHVVERIEQKLVEFSHHFSLEIERKLADFTQPLTSKLNEILNRLPAPSAPQKNINEVTLVELQNHPHSIVKRKAQDIFNFIQKNRPLHDLKELKTIEGIGHKTLEALAATYTV
ncbi:MAG: helix-hairpin-helix domain-containing protein [Gloeomargarita sp. DG02_1_bins_92]